jgi:hypothetical protein
VLRFSHTCSLLLQSFTLCLASFVILQFSHACSLLLQSFTLHLAPLLLLGFSHTCSLLPHSLAVSLSLLGPLIFRHACSLLPQSLPLYHSALLPLSACQILAPALLALLGFLSLTLSCHTVMHAVIVSIDDCMAARLWTALIYEPMTQA